MRPPSAVRRTALSALGAVVLHAGLAGPAAAQTVVTGRVTDADTGSPLEGVVVRLAAPDAAEGEAAVGAFTDAEGRFRLEPERPGRYRLTAERIGYRRHAGDVFLLELGEEEERDVAMRQEAVRLASLEVTSRQQCSVDPEAAEATDRVWREARRALEAARWSAEHASIEIRTRNFERRLEPDLDVEENLGTTMGFGFGATPYRSLPAEELSERGYADTRGDYIDYYAPDAEALLSDAFQRDHCFWLTRDHAPKPGWIGLAFEPVEGREVPEVEGVLWLDAESSELKRLQFDYVQLPFPTSDHDAGGEVEFFRLSSGPWVVRRWTIRMPQIQREDLRIGRYHRQELEVASYEQEGGRVLRITDDGRTIYDFEEATVAGVVHDSVRGGPLEGARVELVGTGRTDTTGAQGRFRFAGVPRGGYRVRGRHPFLAGLGLDPRTAEVDVRPGRLVEARLAVPGLEALARQVCPEGGEGTGALVGQVRSGAGEPAPGARVAAVWPAGDGEGGGSGDWIHRSARTGDRGYFRLCGVPVGREVALRAEHRAGVGSVTETRLSAAGVEVQDLGLRPGGEAQRLAGLLREQGITADPAGGEGEGELTGVIRGSVRSSGDDGPLEAAEVLVGGERAAVTDSAGRFEVRGVEPGRHRVRVTYLGFESQEGLLRVPPGDTVESTVLMDTDPVPLPELSVRVEGSALGGFEERRRRGSGHYVTREEIEETPGDHVTDVLRGVPGLQVVPCPERAGDCIRTTRSRQTRLTTTTPAGNTGRRGGGGRSNPQERDPISGALPGRDTVPRGRPCGVAVFLDGAPLRGAARASDAPGDPGDAVFGLEQIPKEDVQAVEVYTGPAQIPVRFKNAASGCAKAAVVIWTRGAAR